MRVGDGFEETDGDGDGDGTGESTLSTVVLIKAPLNPFHIGSPWPYVIRHVCGPGVTFGTVYLSRLDPGSRAIGWLSYSIVRSD
jgi:hypothetical protein